MDVVGTKAGVYGQAQGARWDEARAREIIAENKGLDGPALPVLHALQEAFGYIPDEAVALVASELNLSRADVFGVISFYHDFRRQPAGRHVVKLCGAEACQSMGGAAVASCAERKLGIRLGETTADGRVSLEPVYCLGLCSVAPSAMVDGQVIGRLDEARVETILAGMEA